MSDNSAASRKDIDDVLNVLDTMMTRIDERFTHGEDTVSKMQKPLSNIQAQLDSIEKRLEISEDERLVMWPINSPAFMSGLSKQPNAST